jgi:hypothetical protein
MGDKSEERQSEQRERERERERFNLERNKTGKHIMILQEFVAKEGMKYFETSVKAKDGIDPLFTYAVEQAYRSVSVPCVELKQESSSLKITHETSKGTGAGTEPKQRTSSKKFCYLLSKQWPTPAGLSHDGVCKVYSSHDMRLSALSTFCDREAERLSAADEILFG